MPKKVNRTIEANRELLKYCVPQSVWRQSPFRIEDDGQVEHAIRQWYTGRARIFGLSAPDQLRAEYAAAFLLGVSMVRNPHHEIWWMRIEDQKLTRYTGQYKDPKPWPENKAEPSIVVHTQLTAKPTPVQTESVRDLIAKWPQAQHLLCGYGLEPIALAHTFMTPIYGQLWLGTVGEITSV